MSLIGGIRLLSFGDMDMSEVPHVLPTLQPSTRTRRDDDVAVEAAVLDRVLDIHPGRPTVDELIRELTGEDAEFGDQDAVRCAVRDLSGCGVIDHQRESVSPTQATLRIRELQDR